jgi:hypothetical protein
MRKQIKTLIYTVITAICLSSFTSNAALAANKSKVKIKSFAGSWKLTVATKPKKTDCNQDIVEAIGQLGSETVKITQRKNNLMFRDSTKLVWQGSASNKGFRATTLLGESPDFKAIGEFSITNIKGRVSKTSTMKITFYQQGKKYCEIVYPVSAIKK